MFINKEQKEKIDLLNHALGTNYRTRPFDLLNPSDLIEAAVYITAEYVDMDHYWGNLSQINSDFDESLEVFNPALWSNLTFEGKTNDDEIDEAINFINLAEDAMGTLKDRAEEKCKWIWEIILTSDFKEVKIHFFGKDINFDKNEIKDVFENHFFEVCGEIDYNGNVEHSAEEFAKQLLNKF